MAIKITGTGSYIPSSVEKNESFGQHQFLNADGSSFPQPNSVIIEKFKAITGIDERRYAYDHLTSSDLYVLKAQNASLMTYFLVVLVGLKVLFKPMRLLKQVSLKNVWLSDLKHFPEWWTNTIVIP